MIDCFKMEFKFPWDTMVNDLIKLSVQRQYYLLMNGFGGSKFQMIEVAAPRLDPGRQSGITETALSYAQTKGFDLIVDQSYFRHMNKITLSNVKVHSINALLEERDSKYIGIRFNDIKGVIVDASAMINQTDIQIHNAIYRLIKDNGDKVIPMIILG